MTDLFDTNSAWKTLEKAMDVSAERHRRITHNIANIDTIGYKTKDVDFRQALEQALKDRSGIHRTHPRHFAPQPGPKALAVSDDTEGAAKVDIDREMTHLMENNIRYRTSIEMLLRKMHMLKNAITEAGR